MKIFPSARLVYTAALIFLLGLTACTGSDGSPSLPEVPTTAPPTMAATIPPPTTAPTEAPPPTSAPTPTEADSSDPDDSCLIGRWIVTDMAPYFLTAFEDIEVKYEGTSGNAWYQFNRDGTVLIEAIDFTQSFTIQTSGANVPADIILDTISFAKYRIEGNKVYFSEQTLSDTVFQIEIFGERTDLEAYLLGDPAAGETAFLYECVGSNQLYLTPPLKNYEVFPVILERYP